MPFCWKSFILEALSNPVFSCDKPDPDAIRNAFFPLFCLALFFFYILHGSLNRDVRICTRSLASFVAGILTGTQGDCFTLFVARDTPIQIASAFFIQGPAQTNTSVRYLDTSLCARIGQAEPRPCLHHGHEHQRDRCRLSLPEVDLVRTVKRKRVA